MDKRILDATAGSRMMWFDKQNPEVLFVDNRTVRDVLCDGRTLAVEPDQIEDFTQLSFSDNSFRLVVFDPPHLVKLGKKTWLAQKYGVLAPTWELDIRAGFEECMRVLMPGGTLIFKWNEHQITLNKVLAVIPMKPLFGHTSAKHGKTIWMAFMK